MSSHHSFELKCANSFSCDVYSSHCPLSHHFILSCSMRIQNSISSVTDERCILHHLTNNVYSELLIWS